MKIQPIRITRHVEIKTRNASRIKINFGSVASALLLAGVMLFGLAGSLHAQPFPASTQIPSDEQTGSLGVLRIDTTTTTLSAVQLADLLGQGSAMYAYPGWNPPYLTTPLLFDNNTCIALGAVSQRLISTFDGNSSYPLGFPQTVGAAGSSGPITLMSHQILSYSDYGGFLPASGDFSGQPTGSTGPREILTAIQAFNLVAAGICSNGCLPQVPCLMSYPTGADTTIVRCGYDNTFNGGAPFNPSYTPYSIGMVDSIANASADPSPYNSDFPANSFFDIYPEITLPPVNNTLSINAIPLSGAVLTTAGLPLIIESQGINSLPPTAVYTHQTTDFGVDLIFRDTCPNIDPNTGNPYWSAGDCLGTVTLAGHNPGVGNSGDPCDPPTAFVNAVFGPPSQLAPSAVIGLIYGNDQFPPSLVSSYASAPGTNFDGSSIDCVQFTNGATTLFVRDFSFSSFANPVPLPAFGSSITYTNPNTTVSLQTSTDGINFLAGSATGAVQITIINTNPPTAPSKVFYYAQLKSFSGSGSTGAGAFKFRQSPTIVSPGELIVQTNFVGNYKIGGFLNTSFEWSFNGGISYVAANRFIQLKQQSVVNCGSVPPRLSVVMLNPGVAEITWNSSNYQLQSSPSLLPSNWTDIPATSPYIFNTSSNVLFYRVICP